MRLVVSEFVSLDMVMEDPGREGYEHGGWTFRNAVSELETVKQDELFASDALLLGRVTYEGFAAAWPVMTDEQGFADRMNNLPKQVVTLGRLGAGAVGAGGVDHDAVRQRSHLCQGLVDGSRGTASITTSPVATAWAGDAALTWSPSSPVRATSWSGAGTKLMTRSRPAR